MFRDLTLILLAIMIAMLGCDEGQKMMKPMMPAGADEPTVEPPADPTTVDVEEPVVAERVYKSQTVTVARIHIDHEKGTIGSFETPHYDFLAIHLGFEGDPTKTRTEYHYILCFDPAIPIHDVNGLRSIQVGDRLKCIQVDHWFQRCAYIKVLENLTRPEVVYNQ